MAASLGVSGKSVSLWRELISKGTAVQRGLHPGTRRISIVRNRYQATTVKHTVNWKRLGVIL
jgi:hypothetical protein